MLIIEDYCNVHTSVLINYLLKMNFAIFVCLFVYFYNCTKCSLLRLAGMKANT